MSQLAVQSRSARPSATRTPQPDPSQPIPVRSHAPPDRLYHVVLLALCTSVLLLAAILSIRDRSQIILPGLQLPLPELCTMRRFFGIDCPGCGLTRCFVSLAHGDVAAAWSYNPAGLWLFAIMAFQIPFRSYQLWRINRGLAELALPYAVQIVLGIFAIGLIAQWVVRLAGVSF